MDSLLNVISIVGSFCATFGILYLVQRFTIGLLPFFKREIKRTISIGDVLFSLSSLIFILSFMDFKGPF
ncbi:hypothetical protein [Viridibacillus sp. FSL H8-0123]|uniref:hypothetical protein n=1 Tax=Viridibacillus sp. FSL H8-0123 TaxID=1928922 RepID=UPI00096D44F5|nr:hypothetical protein [Viridibacillus sp. FSL H8-0123]OMC77259.1 hypothetical protein BK130_21610 [Viridibacillus sp. FSL H8-0123]